MQVSPHDPAVINTAVGALVAIGGIAGFAKSRSAPSLIAGVSFGAIYAYSGYLIAHGNPVLGHQIAAGASLLLAGTMGTRALRTGKFMPAGLVAGIAVAALAYNLPRAQLW
ncbi:hypothetical protein CAOG_04349 [Capsaspora owczarzaki ATCC 30864]|uniref:Transmembrane protein 14C n=1 Tax=Capsaspora owczarzaki (strain ATCC 30864) TaxID=595528 RepID=A0A0D2X328_CAPO3|nr:hypothetical protein CAOG_04349 [Capsaspora owczarzaki ATCC 30864]KJE93584.1 hypothetical protein CAOG_004349 [Capsaspora owczarzaki ATCC 30864]|eukprot:XP_004348177.1 hypothetical protein CAOG_04349 [Capsaspora owczarzaki ATCC 30864]